MQLADIKRRMNAGEKPTKIAKEMDLPYYGVKDAVKRMKNDEPDELPQRKKGSGLAKKPGLADTLASIAKHVAENPESSIKQLAKDNGVDSRSLRRYIRDVAKLRALKKAQVDAVTETHMMKRAQADQEQDRNHW